MLVIWYLIIFCASIGILYICMLDTITENLGVLIFVLELMIIAIIYMVRYSGIKNKFLYEDVYPKWQMVVPKRVGIGYTFNPDCPLTYLILGAVAVIVILLLL